MASQNKIFIARTDGRLGDRYTLLECLGDGSHGWVWKAQKIEDNSIVAIKIPKDQSGNIKDLAEGKELIGKPTNPNVIDIYWMGRVPPENDWYAIEMEYFPSQTLSSLMDDTENGFVASYERIFKIYFQILQGVRHIHSLSVAHGDIKPQNILVSGDQIKITDFGSSVMPEEMYVRTRENGGTILYSAPESAGVTMRGRSLEEVIKSDIYSLGVLLYHLTTSRTPHNTLSQVVQNTPFPRPREINSSISPSVEDFILRCLQQNPATRWNSVAEMIPAFRGVWQAQIAYQPVRTVPVHHSPDQDWSSESIKYLNNNEFSKAESIALLEFREKKNEHALLIAATAAFRDGRFFDCLKIIESDRDLLQDFSPVATDLRRLAIDALIETRRLEDAAVLVETALKFEGENLELLLKKASLLGMQAKYSEAYQILLNLNRKYPQRSPILRRLILVCEQMRDTGKATAFLRLFLKISPDDKWAMQKSEQFEKYDVV